MPLGAKRNNTDNGTSNTNNGTDQQQQSEQGFYEHKSWSDWADIVARWVVDLFAIPISFITAIFAQFLQRHGAGAKILGSLAFWIGTLFGTDSMWQTLFQGTPIFPWFETNWMGWTGLVTLPFNPLFWISLAISYLIQTQEAKTLRSKPPEEAKKDFENAQKYTLPQKPKNTIDLARALWGDYKRAGMRERNSGGLFALFFWLFDLITTFVGRWPFRYTNPGMILGCLAYNVFTMVAGEMGYSIRSQSQKK
jgi:hypothetical protein